MNPLAHPRTFSSPAPANPLSEPSLRDFYIGLSLAISSSIFIGSSFIFKKKALIRLAERGVRAGDGGFGYLFDWMWWSGMILMTGGEFVNFIAYAFAPATLVTPLGALSVLVTAVLSSRCLQDRLNLPGKLGCLICVTGSTMIVLHSPKEQEVQSMKDLEEKMRDAGFIIYTILICIGASALVFYFGPRYGQKNPLVFVTITGSIGSLSVMFCKGLGVAIKETIQGNNQFDKFLTWLIIFLLVVCISIQMNYLNKALDIFNASVVTPLLYVFFTTFVIIASAILFKEWMNLRPEDILGIFNGFATVLAAIFLLHAFKDLNLSLETLNFQVMREDMHTGNRRPVAPIAGMNMPHRNPTASYFKRTPYHKADNEESYNTLLIGSDGEENDVELYNNSLVRADR